MTNPTGSPSGFQPARNAEFVHVERDLAKKFGLSPDTLREARARALTRGVHWELVTKLVTYSDAGVAALRAELKIEPEPALIVPVIVPRTIHLAPEMAAELEKISPDDPAVAAAVDGAMQSLREQIDAAAVGQALRGADCTALIELAGTLPEQRPVAKIGEERVLVCVGTVKNRRVVRAKDGEREAWVRVRDSGNFRPGMKIPASYTGEGYWDLVGRQPRWPGKY